MKPTSIAMDKIFVLCGGMRYILCVCLNGCGVQLGSICMCRCFVYIYIYGFWIVYVVLVFVVAQFEIRCCKCEAEAAVIIAYRGNVE